MRFLATAIVAAALAACSSTPRPLSDRLLVTASAVAPSMVEVRRDLHRHPELSGQEVRTARTIAEYLQGIGLDVRTGVGGHGVVGILRGARPGKVVAYRADMDACPGNEPERELRSLVPGVQHVCGHDVHVAIGLGVASALARHRAELPGTVVFFFQPAEETLEGAAAMIAGGGLSIAPPEAIFALHTFPLQAGQIAFSPGEGFAGSDRWTIELPAVASAERLAAVNETVNALNNTSFPATPDALETFLRELELPSSPLREAVFINTATRGTAIEVFVKASDDARYPELRTRIRRDLDARLGAGTYRLTFAETIFPRMASDPLESERAAVTLRKVLGEENVRRYTATIPYVGEDFALFLQRVPGAMFYLGVANRELGIAGVPHMPDFAIDERAIAVGIRAMTAVIFERLQ